ncbi:MAG: aspartate ammonia-lyase [Oscillospiraceae bacterium]|jgi:aspartate ammonia-lyase|nr:aspartate ammonia-lyase [Oscillospiraceae bacterium]
MNYRTESDCLGELQIADDVYYGVQTERARQNFALPGLTTDHYPIYINAVAAIKKAAALAHSELGVLDPIIAEAIGKAVDEIIDGKLAGNFPLHMLQGGGSTSTNMNVNEVIANRANEILTGHKGYDCVHPNDHVNMGQSTNDVIPAAVKLTAYIYASSLVEELERFCTALADKEKEFASIVKLGRTCLQDAMPVTLGQEFSGYRSIISRRAMKLNEAKQDCLALPLGATAIGTGSGSFAGYRERVIPLLSEITDLSLTSEENLFDGLQNADAYLDVMQAVKNAAVAVSKIATDLRLLSSGPRAGLNEIQLPAVQPGSSIMPGKINPVMPELMNQICYQVCGNELAISMAVEGGELDLNVWEPVVLRNLCESAGMLEHGLRLFRERCVMGIEANASVCRKYAEESLSISSVVSALFDYKTGTLVSQKAYAEDKTIAQAAVELGILSQDEAKTLLDPLRMTNNQELSEMLMRFRREKHSPEEKK